MFLLTFQQKVCVEGSPYFNFVNKMMQPKFEFLVNDIQDEKMYLGLPKNEFHLLYQSWAIMYISNIQFHISILLPSIYISLKKNGYYMHEGPLGYWDEKVCNISNPSSTCYKKGLLNPKPVGILHKSLGGVLNAGTTIESRFKKLSKIVSVYVYIYYT